MSRARDALLTVGAALGAICLLVAVAGPVAGVRPLVFRSGSMGPDIPAGALGLSHPVPASEVRVGDVVSVVASDRTRVTHRVQSVSKTRTTSVLTLRGDANPVPDAETYQVTTVDRVFWSVPLLGRVVAFVGSGVGAWLLGFLACGMVLLVLRGERRPRGGRRRAGRRRAGRRRAERRPVGRRRAMALVAAPVAAVVVTTHGGTAAAFSDTAALTGGAVAAASLQPPATVNCSGAGLLLSPTISWTAPASGPVTNRYRVVYRRGSPSGTETQVFVTGTSWQMPSTILEVLTTYYLTVQTVTQGATWSSKSYATPGITVTVVSVFGLGASSSCGTYAPSQPAW